MTFDPVLDPSKADPCFDYRVKDGQFCFVRVYVNDNAVANSDQRNFDDWLSHCRGTPDADDYLDVKSSSDVTHLLQMRITRQHLLVCIDKERNIGVLAAAYGV